MEVVRVVGEFFLYIVLGEWVCIGGDGIEGDRREIEERERGRGEGGDWAYPAVEPTRLRDIRHDDGHYNGNDNNGLEHEKSMSADFCSRYFSTLSFPFPFHSFPN